MERRKPTRPEAFIPGPAPKAKRDRTWEREQRLEKGQVTYRGIPKALNERIREIAEEKGVTVGEVARAFLEHSLSDYENGVLELRPALKSQKFGLFHD